MSLLVALQPSLGSALVVGGGSVAARKVASLVEAGFAVVVVAPTITESARAAGVQLRQRAFEPGDLEGHSLVFACTGDRAVNRRVGELCAKRGIPVNVADAPAESSFHSVAVHRSGGIQVGVSTGAAGPRLAAAIRDELALALAPEWETRVAAAKHGRATDQESVP